MTHVLHSFVDDPSIEGLVALKREELINLSKHCKLSYKTSFRKQEIKNIVIEGLVDEHVLPYDALDCIQETFDEGSVPEMRIWSILLIISDKKWCIHLSRSLFLYFNY